MAKGKYARKRMLKELRTRQIENIGLSAHTVKALRNAGIENMADIILRSEDDLKSIHGIGEKAMEEIRKVKNNSRI